MPIRRQWQLQRVQVLLFQGGIGFLNRSGTSELRGGADEGHEAVGAGGALGEGAERRVVVYEVEPKTVRDLREGEEGEERPRALDAVDRGERDGARGPSVPLGV